MLIGKAKEEICSFSRSKSKRFGQKHHFPTSLVKQNIEGKTSFDVNHATNANS